MRKTKTSNERLNSSVTLLTHKLSLIRALYVASVASNGPRDEVNREFHQAVGDVLEGIALPDINLTYIDANRVKEEVAWLRERKS